MYLCGVCCYTSGPCEAGVLAWRAVLRNSPSAGPIQGQSLSRRCACSDAALSVEWAWQWHMFDSSQKTGPYDLPRPAPSAPNSMLDGPAPTSNPSVNSGGEDDLMRRQAGHRKDGTANPS